MSPLSSAETRLAAVREQVACAARACGREASDVAVLAVSKLHPPEAIAAMHSAGQCAFGENYAQELVSKVTDSRLATLKGLDWHFIGHLQTNKARDIANRVRAVHSLDRISLLEALEKHRSLELAPLEVYLQLIVDPADAQKHGADANEALRLATRLAKSRKLRWVGFMGMGPAHADSAALLPLYADFVARGRALWNANHELVDAQAPGFSLGMSGDLAPAIAAGSTLVRIGTALFGDRPISSNG